MNTRYSHPTTKQKDTNQLFSMIFNFTRSHSRCERQERGCLKTKMVIALFVLVGLTCSTLPVTAKTKRPVQTTSERFELDKNLSEIDGAEMRRKLALLLRRSDVQLFLEVIKKAEAGEPDLMVGGCRAKTLKVHPFYSLPKHCRYPIYYRRWTYSSASGNYQLTVSNWDPISSFLGLKSFSVTNQKLAALELIRRGSNRTQSGFVALVEGNLRSALCRATGDWASSSCSSLPANQKVSYVQVMDNILIARANNRARKTKSNSRIARHSSPRRLRRNV